MAVPTTKPDKLHDCLPYELDIILTRLQERTESPRLSSMHIQYPGDKNNRMLVLYLDGKQLQAESSYLFISWLINEVRLLGLSAHLNAVFNDWRNES